MKAQITVDVSIKLKREDYNKLQHMADELAELQRQLDGIEEINDLTDLLNRALHGIYEFGDDPRIEIID